MRHLAQMECNEVLVEAGAGLNGALLQAGLVDEFIIYLAPHLLGDSALGMFHLPPFADMRARKALMITDVRQVGEDIRVMARLK
jgi:diaminohydroxyphosphoribosylaminopyrimidine deaminase/5-amino-6-(5-phosphoribosylamino)uracil reductase